MLRHYLAPSLALAALAGLVSSSCKSRDTGPKDAALADSAGVYEKESGMFRKVGETPNLQGPESARYDRDLDVWFVSNINGTPLGKDNNGYISRLRPDGAPYTVKFIEGGKKGVTLNAPKGLAISGDTLWVADIDFARAFNKRTGALIANVSTQGKARRPRLLVPLFCVRRLWRFEGPRWVVDTAASLEHGGRAGRDLGNTDPHDGRVEAASDR